MVLERMFTTAANLRFLEFRVAWPELISPCLWENASIILQLGFLAVLLLHFIRNNVHCLCKGAKKMKDVEKYPNEDVKYSLSFKLSIICSVFMLGAHVAALLMLQRKTGTQCRSKVSVLSSRIMQVISWGITLIVLNKIRKGKYIKFPWILRFWWTSSFLLCLARAMIDAHCVMTNNGQLGLQEYADVISFLASICLLVVSIRGKTGIAFSISDDITEPLLNGKNEKHAEGKRDSPYGRATLIQLVTFSWLNPLFEFGFRKPLDQDEVPDVDVKDSASFLSHEFDQCLKLPRAKLVETIAQRQWIFGARQLGLRLRAALISQIYKKGLILSSQSRQSRTSGEIINYMSVDVQRITDFIWYLNTIWMLPVQISLAIYVLHMNLGMGALVALAATLTVMAGNIPLTRVQKRYQTIIMDAKDDRMKATSEILRSMKTLKLQAWDSHYLEKLVTLRKTEHNWIWKSLRLSALTAFIFWGKSFCERISSYLQEDEIKSDAVEYVPDDQTEFHVEIDGGKFSWGMETRNPTLDGIELKVKRGMKVAICGTVGSGKSSLLSCVLGEMHKLSGMENILFGEPYESDKYNRTIEACALTKDFELFAAGDLTEIGERGINMSGGQKQRIQIARAVYQDADIYLLDDPFSAVDAHTGTQLFQDCLMGVLKDKTILYVTHQVEFLPAADLILKFRQVMQNGKIRQAGTFEELLKQNIGFEVLVGAHNQALESVLTVENSSRTSEYAAVENETDAETSTNQEFPHTKQDSEHNLCLR
ncbi:ABC transporter C family member 9 [Sesamum angolense]|uniref:ABC-type xenobiotic transporter n=1 Tax=Sesamum angolense TaxID=2727404 RepID=A0AAE2BTL8_9LAMI|nr:ABC transporter C family member 9 [Sesamum angolense]